MFLVDAHKTRLRYALDTNRFYKYNVSHWQECGPQNVEIGTVINKASAHVLKELTAYADASGVPGKDHPDYPDWAVAQAFRKLAGTATGTASIISKMKEDERIWCSVNDFTGNPYMLNFQNGTVDVRIDPNWEDPVTGEFDDEHNFLEHSPKHMIANVLDVDYPDYIPGDTPLWTGLLMHMCAGDLSLVQNLECALAYGLLGENPEQLAVFLVGDSGIGKTQVLEIVTKLAGSLGGHGKIELIQRSSGSEHDTIRSELRGKHFVMLGETSHRVRMDETKFKDLTGSQTIVTRKLGQQPVQTKVTWTLYCSTNALPEIPGVMDDAMARRFWIFPLPGGTIPSKDRDHTLTQRIIDQEGPAILYRLARQLAYTYSTGKKFVQHPRCQNAIDTYRAESNTVAEFAEACLRVDEGSNLAYDEVHMQYVNFCKKRSLAAVSRRQLPRELAQVLMCERDKNNRYYKNIAIRFEAPSWL